MERFSVHIIDCRSKVRHERQINANDMLASNY